MLQHSDLRANGRAGVVLLVVITLLTLFAVLGLSFVLYANATADGSRYSREAQSEATPDIDPELLFSYFLGQLLYDTPDDETGVYSALRGHSLARSLFGLNYDPAELGTPALIAARNHAPYSGTGRLRKPLRDAGLPAWLLGQEDSALINYTYFERDGLIRDPERPGVRLVTAPRLPFVGGYNAPYTYPDLNNMYLAAVKADGTVMLPSFHRPWAGALPPAQGFGSLDPANPNWYRTDPAAALLKYMVLRPRPADHNGFPPPLDAGGDVKNLMGYPPYIDPMTGKLVNHDSIWLDLGAPAILAPDGRKFKPLFAPLVMDLDNRVNLNVHGNASGRVVGTPPLRHGSNQGWGPWEVNPGRLMDFNDSRQLEWPNLVKGTNAPVDRRRLLPPYDRAAPPGPVGKVYSPVDLDAWNLPGLVASDGLRLPGTPPINAWQCFPSFSTAYGQGGLRDPLELLDHPKLVNPFAAAPGRSYLFPPSDIEALLRYGDTGSPALTSDLFRHCPLNFGDPNDPLGSLKRRNLVTVHSCDIDRPGVIPFFWNHPLLFRSNWIARMPEGATAPSAARIPFPPLSPAVPFTPDADFAGFKSWRTADSLTALRRLDLNRYLPAFPPPQANGWMDPMGFRIAQRARQYFAMDVYERLWRLTGAGDPRGVLPPEVNPADRDRWDTQRWLAQLAVNIVDFIDGDDYHTPFQWYPPSVARPYGEWVYGTELPRLLINEAYIEYVNHLDGMQGERATSCLANTWVELFNPLATDNQLSEGGAAALSNNGVPLYVLVLSGQEAALRQRDNSLGVPVNLRAIVQNFGPGRPAVLPSNGAHAGPAGGNVGFCVIGPESVKPHPEVPLANLPVSFRTRDIMQPVDPDSPRVPHTILLRRLACPHMTWDPNPASDTYNPYVTVDFMEDVQPNEGRVFGRQGRRQDPQDPPQEMGNRHSLGRRQPFAGARSLAFRQSPIPAVPLPPDMPQSSFFQYNVDSSSPGPNWVPPGAGMPPPPPPGYLPFDWLTHLDRPLISPMELLHVSAYPPHLLTQQFITSTNPEDRFKHRAPWLDEHLDNTNRDYRSRSLRLNRFFEFVTTRGLAAGTGIAEALSGGGPPLFLTAVPTPGTHRVRVESLFGPTATGGTWSIETGSTLLIDEGRPTEEVVRVTRTLPQPTVFFANFLKPHPVGATIRPLIVSDRVPGKININTIWDRETFLALCDPQPANEFSDEGSIQTIYDKMIAKRTPGLDANRIGPGDRPFLGMAVGNAAGPEDQFWRAFHPLGDAPLFPDGSGFFDTFFRHDPERGEDRPTADRLFQVPSSTQHKYFESQLFHKIYNNMTTRSNVFAVWLTVGFFEVKDDSTRPMTLGAEFVHADGKTRRHRMFGVVDRSVMWANPGPQPGFRLRSNPASQWTTGLVVPYYSIIE